MAESTVRSMITMRAYHQGISIVLCWCFFQNSIIHANAMTPTWENDAKFTRGVTNTTYYISPSANEYREPFYTAADNWMYTEWGNAIQMDQEEDNLGTQIDLYAKTYEEDPTLGAYTSAYVSFWDDLGQLVSERGYGPDRNYYYTELTINTRLFPEDERAIILTHEMGHAFGLAHSNDPYSIMFPYYEEILVDTVQEVDNDTINYLYPEEIGGE